VRATSDEIRRIGGGSGSESQTARLTTASKASVTRFEGGSQGERLASRGLNVSHVCDSVTEHNSRHYGTQQFAAMLCVCLCGPLSTLHEWSPQSPLPPLGLTTVVSTCDKIR
jgi:hypothetical protein